MKVLASLFQCFAFIAKQRYGIILVFSLAHGDDVGGKKSYDLTEQRRTSGAGKPLMGDVSVVLGKVAWVKKYQRQNILERKRALTS